MPLYTVSVFLYWWWDYKDQSWGRSCQSEGTWGQSKHIFSLLRDKKWGWLATVPAHQLAWWAAVGFYRHFSGREQMEAMFLSPVGGHLKPAWILSANKPHEYLLYQEYLVPTWTFRHFLSTFSCYMHYLVLQTTCFYLISFLLLIVFISLISFGRIDPLNSKHITIGNNEKK